MRKKIAITSSSFNWEASPTNAINVTSYSNSNPFIWIFNIPTLLQECKAVGKSWFLSFELNYKKKIGSKGFLKKKPLLIAKLLVSLKDLIDDDC